MSRDRKMVGLDIETTGLDPNTHQLIQIGIVYDSPDGKKHAFRSDVGYRLEECVIEEAALKVNGFTRERIAGAMKSAFVDVQCAKWLKELGAGPTTLVAIGWNVGSFDIQFIKRSLPLTAKFFMLRTADLNAMLFLMEAAGYGDFDKLKESAKSDAAVEMANNGVMANWHDALYDAQTAMLVYEQLVSYLKEARLDAILKVTA